MKMLKLLAVLEILMLLWVYLGADKIVLAYPIIGYIVFSAIVFEIYGIVSFIKDLRHVHNS